MEVCSAHRDRRTGEKKGNVTDTYHLQRFVDAQMLDRL
jgi:hypothetical protein